MKAKQPILDRIQRRKGKWYVHLLRMEKCKIVVGGRFTLTIKLLSYEISTTS